MKNQINAKLKEGKTLIGSWITMDHPGIAEIMVNAGFDWVCIDIEHSAIDFSGVESLLRVIDLGGSVPFVRVTQNDNNIVKRVLDSGARGIIVPMVNSEEEAKKAVEACYYPPMGTRGVGLHRANGYGTKFKEYRENLEKEITLVVQIEHIQALSNLEKIFAVKGVNAYMIGPYDLTSSMGIPGEFEHPEFLKALEKIQNAAKEVGLPQGIHIVEPEPAQLKLKIDQGYNFIAYGVDFRMIDLACRGGLRVRGADEKA